MGQSIVNESFPASQSCSPASGCHPSTGSEPRLSQLISHYGMRTTKDVKGEGEFAADIFTGACEQRQACRIRDWI
jgi:hypothetical protein